MASVFKPKGSRKWVILYFDERGQRRKKTGATDKAVTERIARDLENRVALRREGLIDPASERFSNSERKPIEAHLDDFIASMQAKGGDARHVGSTRTYIKRIIATARVDRPRSGAFLPRHALETHSPRRSLNRNYRIPIRSWCASVV